MAAVDREASAPYGGHVWTSTDSGTSFTKDTSVLEPKRWRAVANSADGKTVAAAEIGKPADETGQTHPAAPVTLGRVGAVVDRPSGWGRDRGYDVDRPSVGLGCVDAVVDRPSGWGRLWLRRG